MSTDCRQVRESLGAFALGHLAEDERVAVQAHLDGCAACRQDLEQIRVAASALSLADPARLDDRARPSMELGDRVVSLLHSERLRQRRRLTAAFGSGLAAAALIAALLLVPRGSADRIGPIEFTTRPGEITAAVSLEPREWGTAITLTADGMPDGQAYRVWMEDPAGERIPAGAFLGTDRSVTVELATSAALADSAGIGVSDEAGTTILYVRLPAAAPQT